MSYAPCRYARRWPQLWAALPNDKSREGLSATLARSRLAGMEPSRELVEDLVARARGELSDEQARTRARERARAAADRTARRQADERVFYRDTKPYETPTQWGELQGPATKELDLPLAVYWGPRHVFDLGDRAEVIEAYQAVLREGSAERQGELLNGELLLRVWGELLLPERLRQLWEGRFPELAQVR